MARSEALASLCQPLWEFRAGHRAELPLRLSQAEPSTLVSPLVERILARLDEFAAQWYPLPVDRSVTVAWPTKARQN